MIHFHIHTTLPSYDCVKPSSVSIVSCWTIPYRGCLGGPLVKPLKRTDASSVYRIMAPCFWWSVASTNAVRHLLIQHEDNSTSRQFSKKQFNKIQLNYLPTGHIAIQQLLFQQHPSLNFRTTQQMQPPCSGKIRISFQVQIWLENSKISCKIA